MKNRAEKTTPVGKTTAPYAQSLKIKTETSTGLIKTAILVAVLIVQLVGLIFLTIYFAGIATWAIGLCLFFSLITGIAVLSSNKNASSKAVWIIFIIAFFTFGYILYFMSDERLFFRRAKKRYDAIYKKTEKYLDFDENVQLDKGIKGDVNFLYNTGKFPVYDQTALQYYPTGTQFFDDVIENLKKAEKFIFIEFFIISDGALLSRIIDVLKDRVNNGVDVRIVHDDIGSRKTLSSKTKAMLKEAGIKICVFNRLIPIFSLALNIRNHRKIIVIDGKVAYTGGCNLADEYVNEKRMFGYWKDAGAKLTGKAVDGFTLMFLRQWEFLNKKPQEYEKFLNHYEENDYKSAVVCYADGLDFEKHVAKGVYENMIANAKDYIKIMTPYFIIDDTIMELLINKALSGVEITLIIPEIPDKKYAYGLTRNNAEKLIDYGIKVYAMRSSFVHSKVVLTENSVVVGSINMDFRSFYQQFECAVYTNDKSFMLSVQKDFEKTISVSKRISDKTKFRRNWLYRVYAGFMQLFAPFM